MGWSTELFCNISYNKESFNSKYEVEDKLESVNDQIKSCEEELQALALMTEPEKFMDKEDTSAYYFVTRSFKDNLETLEECLIERFKLEKLLSEWNNCHNDDGLAIYPPENIEWNTAYLRGDFVRSTKYPTNKDLL